MNCSAPSAFENSSSIGLAAPAACKQSVQVTIGASKVSRNRRLAFMTSPSGSAHRNCIGAVALGLPALGDPLIPQRASVGVAVLESPHGIPHSVDRLGLDIGHDSDRDVA